jgi:hypothetical protein
VSTALITDFYSDPKAVMEKVQSIEGEMGIIGCLAREAEVCIGSQSGNE